MSVRPITEGEKRQAYGQPVTNMLALFGATQGLLTHLRLNGTTVHQPWMATSYAKFTFPVCVLGGAAAGLAFGVYFFGDDSLRRLVNQHEQDRLYKIESQKYTPSQ